MIALHTLHSCFLWTAAKRTYIELDLPRLDDLVESLAQCGDDGSIKYVASDGTSSTFSCRQPSPHFGCIRSERHWSEGGSHKLYSMMMSGSQKDLINGLSVDSARTLNPPHNRTGIFSSCTVSCRWCGKELPVFSLMTGPDNLYYNDVLASLQSADHHWSFLLTE